MIFCGKVDLKFGCKGLCAIPFMFDPFRIVGFAFVRCHGFHPWLCTFDPGGIKRENPGIIKKIKK